MTLVTGIAKAPDGTLLKSAEIYISPLKVTAVTRDDAVIIPSQITVVTDGDGALSVELSPANYVCSTRTNLGTIKFKLGVPDQTTVDWAQLVEEAVIVATPDTVLQAQAARDRAEDAADRAESAAAVGGSGGLVIDGGAFILDAALIEANDTLSYTVDPGKRVVGAGDVVQCIKQGWSYTVLALGATGAHRTTASGVLLRVNPSNGSLLPGQFGARGDYNFTTQTGTDDTAALQKMFAYADANRVPVYVPAGNYLYSGQLCSMVSGFDLSGVGKDAVFVKSDSYTGEAFHINVPVSGGMLGTFGSTVGGDTSAKNYHATGYNSWSSINVVGQSRATAGTAFKVSGVLDLFKFDNIGVFNIRGSALVFGGYKGTVRECIFSRWKVRNCGSAEAPAVWFKTDVERGRATVSGTTVTLTSGSFAPIRALAGPRKIRIMGTAAATTPEMTISSFASDTVATLSAAPAIDVTDAPAIWYNDFDGQNNVVMENFDIIMSYGKSLVLSCERLSTARRFALNDMLVHGHGVMPDGDGGDLITIEGAMGYLTSRNLRTNSPEQKDSLRYAAIRLKAGQTITTDKPGGFDLDVHLNNLSGEGEGHIVIEAMGSGRITGIANVSSSAHIPELIVEPGAITGQLVYEVMPATGRASAPSDLLQIADDQKTKVILVDPTAAYAASATISAGAVTLPDGITSLTLDTEGGAATDDLDTITIPATLREGEIVTLRTANNLRDVTIKHGTGNLRTFSGGDVVLSTTSDRVSFLWHGATLNQVGAQTLSSSGSTLPVGVLHLTASANASVAVATLASRVMIDGPLTRSPVYGIGPTGAVNGDKIRFERTDVTAWVWTLQRAVSAEFLFSLSKAGEWAEITYNGTAWEVTNRGTVVTNTTAGLAPPSGGGTTNFLRADGFWATPAAGAWGTITGTLATQTDLQAVLNTKAATSHSHSFASLAGLPTTLAGYGISDGITASAVAAGYQPLDTGLTALSGLSTVGLYYLSASDTWSPVTIGTGLAFGSGTLSATGGGSGVAWGDITGKPTTIDGFGITDAVNTTGNQTVAGAKTFSSLSNNYSAGTGSGTTNYSSGATVSGSTKTVNVGVGGLSGSTTNINLGSAVAGALGSLTINSLTVTFGANVTALNLPDSAMTIVEQADPTKKAKFSATGLTTGTTRTYTLPNANGTLALNTLFSSGAAGLTPASGGGTVNFLRADGSWAAPTQTVQRISTSSDATVSFSTMADVTFIDGPLTRNTVYTLNHAGSNVGTKRITRTDSNAFTWTARRSDGSTIWTAAGPAWADITFDGSTLVVSASGVL